MSDLLWVLMFSSSIALIVIAQRRQSRVTRAGRAALAAAVLVLGMSIVETVIEDPVDPVLSIGFYMICLVVMAVGAMYEFVVVTGE